MWRSLAAASICLCSCHSLGAPEMPMEDAVCTLQVAPSSAAVPSAEPPLVSNLMGERFDILRPGSHVLLSIPQGAEEDHALLHVRARVEPLGPVCSGLLHVTALTFSGQWLGGAQRLEFAANVSGGLDTAMAVRVRVGSSPYGPVSQLVDGSLPKGLAEVVRYRPATPQRLHQHVDSMLVKLALGPVLASLRLVYQREKIGFSNSLWLTTTRLKNVEEPIGGILGLDAHGAAASKPQECVEASSQGDGAGEASSALHSMLISQPAFHGSILAAAFLGEEEDSSNGSAALHPEGATPAPGFHAVPAAEGAASLGGGGEEKDEEEDTEEGLEGQILVGKSTTRRPPAPLHAQASLDDEDEFEASSMLTSQARHHAAPALPATAAAAASLPPREVDSDRRPAAQQPPLRNSASWEDEEDEDAW